MPKRCNIGIELPDVVEFHKICLGTYAVVNGNNRACQILADGKLKGKKYSVNALSSCFHAAKVINRQHVFICGSMNHIILPFRTLEHSRPGLSFLIS